MDVGKRRLSSSIPPTGPSRRGKGPEKAAKKAGKFDRLVKWGAGKALKSKASDYIKEESTKLRLTKQDFKDTLEIIPGIPIPRKLLIAKFGEQLTDEIFRNQALILEVANKVLDDEALVGHIGDLAWSFSFTQGMTKAGRKEIFDHMLGTVVKEVLTKEVPTDKQAIIIKNLGQALIDALQDKTFKSTLTQLLRKLPTLSKMAHVDLVKVLESEKVSMGFIASLGKSIDGETVATLIKEFATEKLKQKEAATKKYEEALEKAPNEKAKKIITDKIDREVNKNLEKLFLPAFTEALAAFVAGEPLSDKADPKAKVLLALLGCLKNTALDPVLRQQIKDVIQDIVPEKAAAPILEKFEQFEGAENEILGLLAKLPASDKQIIATLIREFSAAALEIREQVSKKYEKHLERDDINEEGREAIMLKIDREVTQGLERLFADTLTEALAAFVAGEPLSDDADPKVKALTALLKNSVSNKELRNQLKEVIKKLLPKHEADPLLAKFELLEGAEGEILGFLSKFDKQSSATLIKQFSTEVLKKREEISKKYAEELAQAPNNQAKKIIMRKIDREVTQSLERLFANAFTEALTAFLTGELPKEDADPITKALTTLLINSASNKDLRKELKKVIKKLLPPKEATAILEKLEQLEAAEAAISKLPSKLSQLDKQNLDTLIKGFGAAILEKREAAAIKKDALTTEYEAELENARKAEKGDDELEKLSKMHKKQMDEVDVQLEQDLQKVFTDVITGALSVSLTGKPLKEPVDPKVQALAALLTASASDTDLRKQLIHVISILCPEAVPILNETAIKDLFGVLQTFKDSIGNELIQNLLATIANDLPNIGNPQFKEELFAALLAMLSNKGAPIENQKAILIHKLYDAILKSAQTEEVQSYLKNLLSTLAPDTTMLFDIAHQIETETHESIIAALADSDSMLHELSTELFKNPELQKTLLKLLKIDLSSLKGEDFKAALLNALTQAQQNPDPNFQEELLSSLFIAVTTISKNSELMEKFQSRMVKWISAAAKAEDEYTKRTVPFMKKLKANLTIAFSFMKVAFRGQKAREKWLGELLTEKLDIPGLEKGKKEKIVTDIIKNIFYTDEYADSKVMRAVLAAGVSGSLGVSNRFAGWIVTFIGRAFFGIKVQNQPAVEKRIKDLRFGRTGALPGAVVVELPVVPNNKGRAAAAA